MHIRKVKCGVRALVGAVVLAAVATVTPTSAQAAECGRHEKVTAFLSKKYKEQVTAMGLVSNKGFMQLFVAESGTWTMLLTTPEGVACIVAAGDSYETAPILVTDPNA